MMSASNEAILFSLLGFLPRIFYLFEFFIWMLLSHRLLEKNTTAAIRAEARFLLQFFLPFRRLSRL